MILSIIIPVYNVEKYIERCLKSIIYQNFDCNDVELIVVIDGSKDASYDICKQILKNFQNKKIIYQDNKGLSGARNTGLINAKGDYVWFVDSDDTLEENAIVDFIEQVSKKNHDLVRFCFKFCLNNDKILKYYFSNIQKENSVLLDRNDYINSANFKPMSWLYIYKRNFLLEKNLFFWEGILHEDEEYIVRVLCCVETVFLINKVLYNYYENKGSIMTVFKPKSTFDKLLIVKKYEELIALENLDDNLIQFINKRVYVFYLTILNPSIFYKHTKKERKLILNELKFSLFYPFNNLNGLGFKEKIYKMLINFSILLYVNLRRIV